MAKSAAKFRARLTMLRVKSSRENRHNEGSRRSNSEIILTLGCNFRLSHEFGPRKSKFRLKTEIHLTAQQWQVIESF